MNTHENSGGNNSCCSCRASSVSSQQRALVGGAFSLTNHCGDPVTPDTYLGKYVLVSFGFTNCAVVCPRALKRTSEALRLLGSVATEKLAVLYITVDPERDTPEVLKRYLSAFDGDIIGLTGSREQLDDVMAKFRIFAKRAPDPDAPGGYVVPHTAISYLMGPDGRYVSHFFDATTAEELAVKLRVQLCSSDEPARAAG